MKRITLGAACLMLGLACFTSQGQAQETCGEITIANLNDQAGEFFAALDQYILNHGYDCRAQLVSSTTISSITSMVERGNPDYNPYGWIDLFWDVLEPALAEKRLVLGANIGLEGGVQGWYIPKYLANAHPEIVTVEDALKRPDLFPHPENPNRGAIYNGAEGWGITTATSQLYKAYEAERQGFDLVPSGSSVALDSTIARAYERGESWLGVYWEPTALMAKYDMVRLGSETPYDEKEWNSCTVVADCPNPKPTAWPVTRVYTVMTANFAERAPADVLEYLNKREATNTLLNEILAYMTDSQATGEQGTRYFLETYPTIWKNWVSPEAAEKIAATL